MIPKESALLAKQQRVILMKIKVVHEQKLLEISFPFDLDKDTPESVAEEMKNDQVLSDAN